MPDRKQLGLGDCFRLDAVALQQIKERGANFMIDRGDIRQAIDRCSNIWASLAALVMVSSSIRLTAWIAKFKEAGGTARDWCMSRVTAIILLWLSASSSACHGLLIITVITPLPTASARQMPRTEAVERGNYWHVQMRQRDVAALDAKYEGVSWC